MATATRTTKTGRIVIELDGCSDYYGGALVQGALICKISAPADSCVDQVVADLPRCPDSGPRYIEAIREAVPGIRVYEWRLVD